MVLLIVTKCRSISYVWDSSTTLWTTMNHITVFKNKNIQKSFLIQKNSFTKFHKFYTNYTRLKEKGFWRRTARGNKEGDRAA